MKNHPLVDGNKRLGWLSTAVFLDLNGVDPTQASSEDVYVFVTEVAASHHSVEEIADGVRRIIG